MKVSQQAKLKGPDRVDLIWRRLERHSRKVENRRISSLFDDDAGRAERFAAEHDGLYFDFSKTNIDERTLDWLIELATVARVPRQRDRIFEGHCHNQTEQRAVRHTFLRDHAVLSSDYDVGGVRHRVGQQLGRALNFAAQVRSGDFASSSGREFSDVVNIGIGGSDLGPAMCTAAVASGTQNLRVHFMSNVDGAHVADVLRPLNPERTLVIVCSKTFSTRETMTNAATARAWLNGTVGESASASHMVAVSNSIGRTSEFGVPASQTFAFDEAIGGRFSVWGPVGLSFMIAAGRRKFEQFLSGGLSMDSHFRGAPLRRNIPALLALVGMWHSQVCGFSTRAVIPYEQRLSLFPAYLQQLEMESNGKSALMNGASLSRSSVPVVWGGTGTNAQHAFFQMLHQGTQIVPCEFMVGASCSAKGMERHHRQLVANCLAQSESLMQGRDVQSTRRELISEGKRGAELELLAAHRSFPGNRPSTTLIYSRLTPYTLGQLIALYEHRVMVEGLALGINSFDQWGVELGKTVANAFEATLERGGHGSHNASSARLIKHVLRLGKESHAD